MEISCRQKWEGVSPCSRQANVGHYFHGWVTVMEGYEVDVLASARLSARVEHDARWRSRTVSVGESSAKLLITINRIKLLFYPFG